MTKDNLEKLLNASQKSLSTPGGVSTNLPKSDKAGPAIYLFRHGETKDNHRLIFSGRRNTELTETGLAQASLLAKRMQNEPIDLAFCPPLKRCQKTLKIVLEFHQRAKIKTSPLLIERDYGHLTGKSKLRLNQKDPVLTARYRREYDFPPPDGESLKMVWENRIKPFCSEIEQVVMNQKINIAICCTNNTMRLIRMKFEGLTIEQMQQLENPLASDYCRYVIC